VPRSPGYRLAKVLDELVVDPVIPHRPRKGTEAGCAVRRGHPLLDRLFQVRVRRTVTTNGTGGRVDPTSNDAGDPSPIAGLFANADPDHGAAAPVEASAGLRSPLWAAP